MLPQSLDKFNIQIYNYDRKEAVMRTAEEIERTKESLKDALFALMAQKEYPGTTMSEAAQKAGYG